MQLAQIRQLKKPDRRPQRAAAVHRFAPDSPLEGSGFELVWGFSCQVGVFGLLPVLCSEREGPFFVPSPTIRFAERAEGEGHLAPAARCKRSGSRTARSSR